MKLLAARTILAGAMVLSVALPAWAAEERMPGSKTEQNPAMEKQIQLNRLNGEIAAIDQAAKIVTVKAKRNGKEFTVVALVDDHTGIRDGRISKSLGDLQ